MEERPSSNRFFDISASAAPALLGLLLLLTAFRGVLYIVFIPPWQSPDEPTHFEYAQVLASGGNLFRPRPDLDLQGRIIRSLDRFQFWRLVFVEAPDPLPETFSKTPFLHTAPSQLHKNPPLYYLIASIFLRLDPDQPLLSGMYQLRVLSLLLTLLTIAVVFAAAREFAPEQPFFCLVVAVFAAFLPQFMVVGTSVSPDPLVNLLGSLMIWGALRSLREGLKAALAAKQLGVLVLGFLASYKFFMIIPALVFWLLVVFPAGLSSRRARLRLVPAAVGALAAAITAAYLFSPRLTRIYSAYPERMAAVLGDFISGRSSPPPGYWSWFHRELFKSTWLKFGWLKFEFAPPVYSVLRAVTVASAAGVAWTAVKTMFPRKKRDKAGAGPLLILVAFTLSVLVSYYCFWGPRFQATTTQGRHFFIALPAGAILIVLGWGAFFPRRWRNLSYLVFVGGMVYLDLLALFGYIRPTFA